MRLVIVLGLAFVLVSCGGSDYTPKPHGYPRVYYPNKQYKLFDSIAPYSFMIPSYSVMQGFEEDATDSVKHPYWYNLHFLPFNATLHLSYHTFKNRQEFDQLFDDTRRLVYKHDIKADEIEEIELNNLTTHTSGIVYELKGNTATNLNFYISDGKKHFLRGALYFNAKTEIDSIQPIFDFLKKDIYQILGTTEWR